MTWTRTSASLILLMALSVLPLGAEPAPADPKPLQTITLKDGTQLKGRLVSMDDTGYWVETTSLGKVKVLGTDLVSLTSGEAGKAKAAASSEAPMVIRGGQPGKPAMDGMSLLGNLDGVKSRLLNDPQLQESLSALLDDPAIKEIISDPQLQQQIYSFDIQGLQSNPKIQTLMNNPQMQRLIQKLQGQFLPALDGSTLTEPQ